MTEQQIESLCERELQNALERIRTVGPDRVVINREGVAVSAADAATNGILPAIVFIRNDGWSLGERSAAYAERSLWRLQLLSVSSSAYYEDARASLGAAGFGHEEVSNWAKPGMWGSTKYFRCSTSSKYSRVPTSRGEWRMLQGRSFQ